VPRPGSATDAGRPSPAAAPAAAPSCGFAGWSASTPATAIENVFIRVLSTDGDRVQRMEMFDVADTDRALARFAELCA
jgi:hypothetical protein